MKHLSEEIAEIEDFVQGLKDSIHEEDDAELMNLDYSGDDESVATAFTVMKDLMDSFKAFCDKTEMAWKIQELPATLRQRLITIDKMNQDKYQQMFLWVQKYAQQMKQTKVDELPEGWNKKV